MSALVCWLCGDPDIVAGRGICRKCAEASPPEGVLLGGKPSGRTAEEAANLEVKNWRKP